MRVLSKCRYFRRSKNPLRAAVVADGAAGAAVASVTASFQRLRHRRQADLYQLRLIRGFAGIELPLLLGQHPRSRFSLLFYSSVALRSRTSLAYLCASPQRGPVDAADRASLRRGVQIRQRRTLHESKGGVKEGREMREEMPPQQQQQQLDPSKATYEPQLVDRLGAGGERAGKQQLQR